MTVNRNKPEDVQKTKEMLKLIEAGSLISSSGKSWLGHAQGAAKIDFALLKGAPMSELEQCRGGVREHFRHLKTEHGLEVSEHNGIWSFNK